MQVFIEAALQAQLMSYARLEIEAVAGTLKIPDAAVSPDLARRSSIKLSSPSICKIPHRASKPPPPHFSSV